MTDNERIDVAIGQIAILKNFCIALIVAHPEPQTVLGHFARAGEIAIAKLLPTQASEEMLAAVQKMNDDLLKVLQSESQRR